MALTLTTGARRASLPAHIRVEPTTTRGLPSQDNHEYAPIRDMLRDAAKHCKLSLVTVERALYMLTKEKSVGRVPGRTWSQYQQDLLAAAAAA